MSDLLPLVKAKVLTCTACWLHTAGSGPVPYRGPSPAPILVIGEAPGDDEDRERKPFIGRAGKLIQSMLRDVGINPDHHVAFVNVVSCVAEGSTVAPIGRVSNSYRRWYSGPMVRISAGLHQLTITPNHPVLTKRGWIAAGDLIPHVDEVVRGTPSERTPLGDPHVVNMPSFAEEVHRSLAVSSVCHRVVGTDMDFHGDGMNAEVEVVAEDGLLRSGIEPFITKPVLEDALQGTDPTEVISLMGLRHGPRGFLDLISSTRSLGFSSGFRPAPSFVEVDPLVSGRVVLTGTAEPDPVVNEALPDGISGTPEIPCNGFNRVPEFVVVDDLVRGEFEGHVYNLSTESETYAAEGIIVHNCWPGRHKKGYRTPAADEIAACNTNLLLQVQAAEPEVTILLGATALNAFRPDLQITRDRGRPMVIPELGGLVVPSFHPSACLRVHHLKPLLLKDLKQVRWRWKKDSGAGFGRWPEDCRVCHGDVETYDEHGVAWCHKHSPNGAGKVQAVPVALDLEGT